MTDREQIIAAAKEAGFDVWIESVGPIPFWIERFYALAFAAGAASRDAEIAGLVAFMQEVARNTSDHTTTDVIDEYLAKVRKPC